MVLKNKEEIHGVSAIVFTFAALIHAFRLSGGWDLVLGPFFVPQWVSVVAAVLATYLAYVTWQMYDGSWKDRK